MARKPVVLPSPAADPRASDSDLRSYAEHGQYLLDILSNGNVGEKTFLVALNSAIKTMSAKQVPDIYRAVLSNPALPIWYMTLDGRVDVFASQMSMVVFTYCLLQQSRTFWYTKYDQITPKQKELVAKLGLSTLKALARHDVRSLVDKAADKESPKEFEPVTYARWGAARLVIADAFLRAAKADGVNVRHLPYAEFLDFMKQYTNLRIDVQP